MPDAFVPYPLHLSYALRRYAFGGRAIVERLGKPGLPDGAVAESWEVSDHASEPALVLNGVYRGRALGELVQAHPDALVRRGWRGPHLPLLVKLLDACHTLPVHVHPDGRVAAREHGEPNGKDEAWHVLAAPPGASVLVGVHPGVSRSALRAALLAGAYDDVMPRHGVAVGDTVDVPAGVLHTFGPDTLILEVQQTSDLAASAAPSDVYGRPLSRTEWEANVDATLERLTSAALPVPRPGSVLHEGPTHRRVEGCRNARYVLERWTLRAPVTARLGEEGFVTLTNLGAPLTIAYEDGEERVERASSCLLPASLGPVTLRPDASDGADLVLCFEPDPLR